MPKSIDTVSTERSSVCTRLLSPSLSVRSIIMTPKASHRRKLSLGRAFSLRRFQGKAADSTLSSSSNAISDDAIPKEIKIDMEIHMDGREATTYTPPEVNVNVIKNKRAQERRKEEDIKLESFWKSPTKNGRLKDTTKENDSCLLTPPRPPPSSAKKQMLIPSLMSPASKTVVFRNPEHERLTPNRSADAIADKAWKLEKPPNMLSRASPPSRTVQRYASSHHLCSIHATPIRPKLHKQTSVYIPKADLDKLCHMYDDIVDTPFRAH